MYVAQVILYDYRLTMYYYKRKTFESYQKKKKERENSLNVTNFFFLKKMNVTNLNGLNR